VDKIFSDLNFDNFFNVEKSKKQANGIELTEEEYRKLKEKAEKYDALVAKFKELKEQSKNNSISDETINKLKEKAELSKRYLEKLTRLQADFENFRRISERENNKFKKYALKNILIELLKIQDNLQRALDSAKEGKDPKNLQQGLQIILNNLKKLLEREGVKPIDAIGEIFDPRKHHVCMVENIDNSEEIPENTILDELEKGYYYKGAVLRPSMVKIAKSNE